jgi:superfamily I DNA/RNA helicase
MKDRELSSKDSLLVTASFLAYVIGGIWMLYADCWADKLGALALVVVPGRNLVSIMHKYRKPNLGLILDNPLREIRKKELEAVKARWQKANDGTENR